MITERIVKRAEIVVYTIRQVLQDDGTWDEVDADPMIEEEFAEAVVEEFDGEHWGQTQAQLEALGTVLHVADCAWEYGKNEAAQHGVAVDVRP